MAKPGVAKSTIRYILKKKEFTGKLSNAKMPRRPWKTTWRATSIDLIVLYTSNIAPMNRTLLQWLKGKSGDETFVNYSYKKELL